MERKVLFYNLFVRKNGEAYKVNLLSLLTYIKSLALDDRKREVNGYYFKIHEIYEEENEIKAISFSKQRDDKPYTEK